MRRSPAQLLVGALFAATSLFTASSAFAYATCKTAKGTVVVKDPSTCNFQVSGGCMASCTPINFSAQCSGQCQGQCTASVDAKCTASCGGSCMANCTGNPGSFDCEGSCNTDCSASCTANCKGKSDGASCQSQCSANCQTDCNAKCTAVPPSAMCDAKCNACCGGSCDVQANFDCDLKCDASCTASLMGGCTAKCSDPQGALFCDGQFIDISSITDCSFMLEVSASAKASCAAAPTTSAPVDGAAIAALVAGVGAVVARRRNKKS